jgi:hypothetical protein
MFRKLILALGATAVIAATALSPTAASAKHWHHWNHGHYWGGGYYPVYYGGSDCYTVKQVYWNYSGKHVRLVRVCD